MNLEKTYELMPRNGRKSFYGKALVEELPNGDEVLYSYRTKICTKTANGDILRHYDGEKTYTTCAHLKSFLGLSYKGFWKREVA